MAEGERPEPTRPRIAAKSEGAFRTIGEVTRETGVAAHVLRYWETRFPQLAPVTRAGNRRYYRPEDVALVARIDRLLHREGYTIRGVQQLLDAGTKAGPPRDASGPIRAIRNALRAALDAD